MPGYWIRAVLRVTVHFNADIPAAGKDVNDDVYVFLVAMGALSLASSTESSAPVMQSLYAVASVPDNNVQSTRLYLWRIFSSLICL